MFAAFRGFSECDCMVHRCYTIYMNIYDIIRGFKGIRCQVVYGVRMSVTMSQLVRLNSYTLTCTIVSQQTASYLAISCATHAN